MSGPSDMTRMLVVRRDRYRCVRCGRDADIWNGHSIHHRHLRSHPFERVHEASNLILLCGSGTSGCHGWVHAHPAQARRYGWLVSMSCEHPETVPLWNARLGWILIDDQGHAITCDRDGHPETRNPIERPTL